MNFGHIVHKMPSEGNHSILENEEMEEVRECKYLGTVLCKHGGMEGEIRE